MPVLGITDPYEWLRSLRLDWRVMEPAWSGSTQGGGSFVMINTQALSMPQLRRHGDARIGWGIEDLVAMFMHEARHTVPGGGKMHSCPRLPQVNQQAVDPSLSSGGAYAVGYWFQMWCANHTTSSLYTESQREYLRRLAGAWRGPGGRFCDEFAATRA